MTAPTLTRTQAAALIERVRELLSERSARAKRAGATTDEVTRGLLSVFDRAGVPALVACDGEAHSNAYIDHCGRCAPRWGWIGEKVRVR